MKQLVLLCAMVSGLAAADIETVEVEDPRPLGAAIAVLRERFGWRVSYEDPPYKDARDLVDRTAPTYRGPRRALDPRGGPLEVSFLPSDPPEVVLRMLIDEHRRRGYPGRFVVRQLDGVMFVLPEQGSVLDTPVTLEDRDWTYWDVVFEVLRQVSQATGVKVDGPGFPRPQFERFKFTANREPARQVLLRLFDTRAPAYQFTWQLLYGPNWGYALNLAGKQVDPAQLWERPRIQPRQAKPTKKGDPLPDGSKRSAVQPAWPFAPLSASAPA